MPKNYNIGKASDMRRLQRDLEKDVKRQVVNAAQQLSYHISCPNCGATFQASPGLNRCPQCGKSIDLDLDFHF